MVKQKVLRKFAPLSDVQSRQLYELSEYDGVDAMEHVRRAIDGYLQKQKQDYTLPKEQDIHAELREKSQEPAFAGAVWVSGVVDKYEFSALLLNGPAKSGIERGRILKLSIWDPVMLEESNNFVGACIVNYDRGWDIRPSKIAEPYYNKVKNLIDNVLLLPE
jgi:hypothetical protein